MHVVEASYVSVVSVSAFRVAFVRFVWSGKMPLASTKVILNLLDGPVGVDLAFHFTLSELGFALCDGIWLSSRWRFPASSECWT